MTGANLVISSSKWASLNSFIRFPLFACVDQFSPVSLFYTQSKTQAGTACGKRLARTNRIYEDQEVSQAVLSRCEVVLSWCEDQQNWKTLHFC